ncbi:hypothetical protein [Immundisolibacter sp.]|uniref:hypothetical protein n=1 Tax=Immundisolibacter sp. TaxID=1934948 RepID=UPI00356432D2
MLSDRLPWLLLLAYGAIAFGEGLVAALNAGVGTELSRAAITLAGVLWVVHGLRRGQAWAWWLTVGGATVFLVSVVTALVLAASLQVQPALTLSVYAKSGVLLAALVVLLPGDTRRRYLAGRHRTD